MNERIRELAKQAQKVVGHTDGGYTEIKVLDQEKFAQLIVKECADYINERTLDWDAELRWIFRDGSGDMAVDVDDLLNRHFGVE